MGVVNIILFLILQALSFPRGHLWLGTNSISTVSTRYTKDMFNLSTPIMPIT